MIVLRLPPEISHPRIRAAADTYRTHVGEFRQLETDRYQLQQTRDQARERDVHAAAAAHRAGKADPGQPNLEEHDAKLAEARRRETVLAEVVRRDGAELLDAIGKHADAWQEKIDQRVVDARVAVGAALDQVAAAHRELQAALAVSGWLNRVQDGRPESAQYMPAAYAVLPPNRYSNGEPRRADEIIEDLRFLATEPPRRSSPRDQRTPEQLAAAEVA